MKQLTKGPKPEILVQNEADWTQNYVAASDAESLRRAEKWRHAEIKNGLRTETSGRCVYCESLFEANAFLEVEHIIPKNIRKDLAHAWANLTAACPRCNRCKGAYFSESSPILNPYKDQPEDELILLGDFIVWKTGSVKGETTVRELELNRIDLKEARARRLMALKDLIERWHEAATDRKAMLAAAIRYDVDAGEFVSYANAFLKANSFPLVQ